MSNFRQQSQIRASWPVWLRFVTLLVTIIAFGLQIKVAVDSGRDNYSEVWYSPESFAFLGLSFIWNIADLATRFSRQHGVHPGAHVGLDLIIWIGLFSSAVIQLLINAWYSYAVAAGTLKIVCCILHIILFVWACVACHQWRNATKAAIPA
ncbi:uncharacterized protein Z518_06053 [Rhinocladiella mackenziei CBS 650.93]|uniref:MARVEL domain-containing protein n=1 Tax=Rhinocladiella mackenziei CBS 650.93 TaxID=1442369 RepID=A0A0D2IPS3_9EURO|nr:uncharacterized protein Z518_06053 [Rhinocladiella mackenziei CBS 650.93]KIX05181.1 hypothetical protein Z518_06053 [Rhinocladiella mackenziei CBS 650.93]